MKTQQALDRADKRVAVAREAWRREGLITVDEFCTIARVSRATFYSKLVGSAGFPTAYRPGARNLYKRAEVDAWIDSRAY